MAMTSSHSEPVLPRAMVLPVDHFGVRPMMLSRMVIMLLALVFGASGAMARNVVYEVKSQALSEVIDTLSDLSGIAGRCSAAPAACSARALNTCSSK